MAKDKALDNSEEEVVRPESEGVVPRGIVEEMRVSFLDYAMSVITDRALPDVRDGLKPVHRRILFAMHEMGLTASAKNRKSAAVVGEVLGNYHPHGDIAVYQTLVGMVQPFSMRYPLALGQGNFGNIDGDGAAAHRYTEAKMSRIAAELLRDLEKETVDMKANYDGTKKEPVVLPTAVPNLLLNGTLGIAVGMASSIPPHNLGEVIDATNHLLENPEATTEDLLEFIKGPDFPTGGIAYGEKDIAHAYAHGKGGIVVRGEAEIIEEKSGKASIIISSIPYRLNKSDLILAIAELVREKKLEGIKDLRDESTDDVRIVIELKSGAYPQQILNYLYKHTRLEEAFNMNAVALVDGVPQTMTLKGFLEEFIGHRKIVIRRRTEFDLRKAEEREHILLGLKKALDHIDQIIKLIRASKDVIEAHKNLMKEFKFSDRQATAILEMRLQRLANLERQKVEDELDEVQKLIKSLREILASTKKIISIISKELGDIKERYADPRRTRIVKHGAKNFSIEDVIPDEESVLILTSGGYIKRTSPDEYRQQKRGGVGVVDLNTKEEDFVTNFLNTSTHSDLLFFTDKGKAYQIKMYDIPEGKRATRGKSIMNFLSVSEGENVTSILPMPKLIKSSKLSLMLTTKNGVAKKVAAASFHDVRRSGIIAIRLESGDELVAAAFVEEGDEAIVVSSDGQSIRFKESDVREMGRSAGGVGVIKLDKGARVVGSDVIKKGLNKAHLMVMTANGYGKQTDLGEYKTQNRNGSGIITVKITTKTGELIASRVITEETLEIVAMSKKSQVIRIDAKEIPSLGRQTQGVRVMKMRDGDSIASLVTL